MADRSIVTQVGLGDLKFALQEVAQNLFSHINSSLSKAHGLNIINGYVDSNGNDLTTFQDSQGNVMGNYQILFFIGNVPYFAPANLTALAGQPETNGSINTDTAQEDAFSQQGGSAWVTGYTSDQVAQAEAINTDVLVGHTQQIYYATHGNMAVTASTTFNSLGAQVGTHLVTLRYNGLVYQIPVCDRFGGPSQLWRGFGFAADNGFTSNTAVFAHNYSGGYGSGSIFYRDGRGTLPRTVTLQINERQDGSGNWTDVPLAGGSFQLNDGNPVLVAAYDVTYPQTLYTFTISVRTLSDHPILLAVFRVKIVNEAGTIFSPTCFVYAYDLD
jgi:hypothetical protein